MNIQGTITVVSGATPPNQNGLMYQNITVVDAQGVNYQGKVAFKKAPYVANTPFNGTADLNADGSFYFRKVNPQYANQVPQPQNQTSVPPQMPTANVTLPTNPPASQSTYTPVKQPDGRNQSIERQSAIKSACALLAGTNADTEEVVKTAERFTYFYESGKAQVTGNQDGFLHDNREPNYEDIPD